MKRPGVHAVLFVSLILFWLALSGRLEPLFIVMGVVSAAVVTWFTGDLVSTIVPGRHHERRRLAYRAWRTVVYLVWLIGRIFVASVQVAYFTIHPRVPIDPGVLHFTSTIHHPVARAILTNSISLVPGTLTVRVTDDEYEVHTLFPAAADDLLTGKMQAMVGAPFLERSEPAPRVVWTKGARR